MRTRVRHWPAAVLIAVLSSGSVGVAAYLLDQHDVHIGLTAQVETVRHLPIRCDPRLPFGCEPSAVRPGPPPFTLPTFPTFPGEPPPFTLPPFTPPPTEQPPPPPPVAPTTTTTAPPTTTRKVTIPLMTVDMQAPTTSLTDPPTTAPPTSHALAAGAAIRTPPRATSASVFGNPMVILTMIVVLAAVGIAGGKAAYDHRKDQAAEPN